MTASLSFNSLVTAFVTEKAKPLFLDCFIKLIKILDLYLFNNLNIFF